MTKRASIFSKDMDDDTLDLNGFDEDTNQSPLVDFQRVVKASKDANFVSREASQRIHSRPDSIQKRIKVSRSEQLSARIQRKHAELFYKIANSSGRKNAEILEEAIELCAKKYGISE